MLFTNCQNQLQIIHSASTEPNKFLENPSAVTLDPFAESKIQIAKDSFNEQGSLPAGTQLIAIASNECIYEEGQELSEQIYSENQEFESLDIQSYTWKTKKELSIEELQNLAANDPCIKGVAADSLISTASVLNDSFLSQAAHFQAIGGLDTYNFFNDKSHGSMKSVIVAVIDSGITSSHFDISNQLWHGPNNEIGYNFVDGSNNPEDDNGHGSYVSGIIAAQSNNNFGIAGVMGHNIRLMSLKVQNSQGLGPISNVISAINYARANGAEVINISLQAVGANAALMSALATAANENIFIALAAGNSSLTISPSANDTTIIPAYYGFQISGAMTVGSTIAFKNEVSSFSNISSTYVEIGAPGSGGVFSTWLNGDYISKNGTSFSAPQVAGAAALTISFLKQHNISYTAALIENIIAASAYRSSALTSSFTSGRVLDLRGLKEYLQATYIGTQSGGFSDF